MNLRREGKTKQNKEKWVNEQQEKKVKTEKIIKETNKWVIKTE